MADVRKGRAGTPVRPLGTPPARVTPAYEIAIQHRTGARRERRARATAARTALAAVGFGCVVGVGWWLRPVPVPVVPALEVRPAVPPVDGFVVGPDRTGPTMKVLLSGVFDDPDGERRWVTGSTSSSYVGRGPDGSLPRIVRVGSVQVASPTGGGDVRVEVRRASDDDCRAAPCVLSTTTSRTVVVVTGGGVEVRVRAHPADLVTEAELVDVATAPAWTR